MENKYYTPTIEEFCEGFEYEYNYKNKGWVKEKFSIGSGDQDEMAGDWYEFSPNCPYTECRVKCLDKEDIESLGWEHEGSRWFNLKNVPGKLGYFNYVKFKLWGDNSFIKGYKYDPITCPANEQEYLFQGNIKNKHELKRLMAQLHIL